MTPDQPDVVAIAEPPPWREVRPDSEGNFDELVFRFADGMVHVETMTDKSVYLGFYYDDGRAHQLWIGSKKKLSFNHADASGPPPRFTAKGLARAALSSSTVQGTKG